jgi:hypothetical protein
MAIKEVLCYPKENKTGYSRDTCTPMFITALFTIAKIWKQPRCPTTDKWIKKLWYIYTMEYYSAIMNNDMWFEGKWMQLEDIVLSEVSQDQKHKRHVFFHMWKIDPEINKYTKTSMIICKLINSGTTLWNLGKDGKEKRMIEHQ